MVKARPYLPVALVARLPDGQLVVLHGQAAEVDTSYDIERRSDGYTTAIEWRPGQMTQTRLPSYCPGVQLHDDTGIGGPLFHPEPWWPDVTARANVAELRARLAQLETTGQALIASEQYGDDLQTTKVSRAALHEFRAVLDGNATPTDREDPHA
jgi:hypothetical protein